MSGDTADKLLTAAELGERWQIPGNKPAEGVYRMAREGLLPEGVVVKLGRRYVRFRLAGIEEFEQQGGVLDKEAA